VLALSQLSAGHSDGSVCESIKGILSVFGHITGSQALPLPANSAGLAAHVFEYQDAEHARNAVQAIGDRPGASFSLHMLNSSSTVQSVTSDGESLRHTADVDATSLPHTVTTSGTMSSEASEAGVYPQMLRQLLPVASSAPIQAPPCVERMPDFTSGGITMAPQALSGCKVAGQPLLTFQRNEGDNHGARAFVPTYSSPSWASHPSQHQPWIASQLQPSVSCPAAVACPTSEPGGFPWPLYSGQRGAPHGGAMYTPDDHSTQFDVNEAASCGLRARSTVMVRNIPCRWTGMDFLNVMEPIIDGEWDLLYMPCKAADVVNSGYAFVNFRTSLGTLRLYLAMHGRRWPNTRSGKVCEIRYARIQGKQLLTRIQSGGASSVFWGYIAHPDHSGGIVMHGPDVRMPMLQQPMQPHVDGRANKDRRGRGGPVGRRGTQRADVPVLGQQPLSLCQNSGSFVQSMPSEAWNLGHTQRPASDDFAAYGRQQWLPQPWDLRGCGGMDGGSSGVEQTTDILDPTLRIQHSALGPNSPTQRPTIPVNYPSGPPPKPEGVRSA
jgi:hypothetical protein